jgi:non-specific serine/threonine protein kinase
MLSVQQILARLDDRFNLLTRGLRTALPRHQTLRETIEWSYNLLSEKECLLFRRLAVFMGGWTIEAAEDVCSGKGIQSGEVLDLLSRLVDKSLVLVRTAKDEDDTFVAVSYHSLETIRQFAREKLAGSAEEERIQALHLQYFLKLAQKAEPELYGAGQIEWLQRLENEHQNMRAALDWSLQRDATSGRQLAAALWWSWNLNGHSSEGYEWLDKLLATISHDEKPIRAKLLSGQAELAIELGYVEAAKKLAEESIALFRKLGDEHSIAFPLSTLANNPYLQSDYEQITQLAMESLELFKRAGNKWGVSRALRILGYNAGWHEEFEQARKYYEESLSICKEIGDQEGMAFTLYTIAGLSVSEQDKARTMKMYEEALKLARAVNSKPTMANILTEMGQALSYNGDYEKGRELLQESLEVNREMGNQGGMARSLRYLGWTARLQRDYSMARSLYSESLKLGYQIQNKRSLAVSLIHIGNFMLVQGSAEKFVCMLASAESADPDSLSELLPCFDIETREFIAAAHAMIGEQAYAAAWKRGQQMSLDEAVAYALSESE